MDDHPLKGPLAQPGALVLWWLWIAASALILGAPLASLAGGVFAQYPGGDAQAFAPGGWHLLEFLQRSSGSLEVLGTGGLWGLLGLLLVSEVPVATFVAQRQEQGSLISAWGIACARLPWLVVGALATRLVQGLLIFFSWIVGAYLLHAAAPFLTEPTQTLTALAASCLPLTLVLGVGVARDVWRVQLLGLHADPLTALNGALCVLRSRALSLVVWWALPTLAAWTCAVVTGCLVAGLGVERPEAWRWGASLLLHQLAACVVVYARAVWCSAAIQISQRT